MLRCSISRAGRAECPIRHSARQKTELELELGQEFTLAEPSQAQHSIPVTSSSRARAYEHSPRAELGQLLLAQARLVYMPRYMILSFWEIKVFMTIELLMVMSLVIESWLMTIWSLKSFHHH